MLAGLGTPFATRLGAALLASRSPRPSRCAVAWRPRRLARGGRGEVAVAAARLVGVLTTAADMAAA